MSLPTPSAQLFVSVQAILVVYVWCPAVGGGQMMMPPPSKLGQVVVRDVYYTGVCTCVVCVYMYVCVIEKGLQQCVV